MKKANLLSLRKIQQFFHHTCLCPEIHTGTVVVEETTQCFLWVNIYSTIESIDAADARLSLQHPPKRTIQRKLLGFLT
jgi:hypothetical protein